MTDIKYDPELPFVVAYSSGDRPLARFRHTSDADRFRSHFMSEGVIVETTPKPKIPEDAEFIIWRSDPSSALQFAEKTQDFWAIEAIEVSDEELLSEIGDAEVTVLVRKEDA